MRIPYKFVQTFLATISLAILTTFLLQCTSQLAGSVTEGGNTVSGKVVYKGEPVSGAMVSLRAIDYVKDPVGLQVQRSVAANVVTDKSGNFTIDSLDAGDFYIVASTGDSLAILAKIGFPTVDSAAQLPELNLIKSAEIKGVIVNEGKTTSQSYVQVYGLDVIAKVDTATGLYHFKGLPESDNFVLRVQTASPLYNPFILPDVAVASGEIKTLDTISITSFADEDYSRWNFYTSVSVNTTPTGAGLTGSLVNFPILVRLRTGFLFSDCAADGHDLRFESVNGTHLPYEIEKFDPYSNTADIWVLLDTIHANAITNFNMYYGNSRAPEHSLAALVFDTVNGFESVWHLNNRAALDRTDATAHMFTAFPYRYDGDEYTDGVIGACDSLDETSDKLISGNVTTRDAISLSMWVNIYQTNSSGRQYLIAKAGNDKTPVYSLLFNEKNALSMNLVTSGKADSLAGGTVPLNTWCYVTGTYDGGVCRIFVDGIEQKNKAIAGLIDSSKYNVQIGDFEKTSSDKLRGQIDEVRIMRKAKSPDWIKMEYENQKAASTVVTVD